MKVTAEDVKDFEAELSLDEPPKEPEEESTEPKPSDEEMDRELGLDDEAEKAQDPAEAEPESTIKDESQEEVEKQPEPETKPVEPEEPAEDEIPTDEPQEDEIPTEDPVEDETPTVEPPEDETPAKEPPEEGTIAEPGEEDLTPEEIKTTVVSEPPEMKVEMDFRKLPLDEELKGLTEKELRKLLSKQAAHVKPLLLLSKEADVDVGPAKRLIAKGVTESKGGDMTEAIKYMGQGVEIIESRYKVKLNEDLNALADMVRELKVSGMDVTKAVNMLSGAKERVDDGQFRDALDRMNDIIELIEKARS
jgi:hypothetical protein